LLVLCTIKQFAKRRDLLENEIEFVKKMDTNTIFTMSVADDLIYAKCKFYYSMYDDLRRRYFAAERKLRNAELEKKSPDEIEELKATEDMWNRRMNAAYHAHHALNDILNDIREEETGGIVPRIVVK